MKLLPDAVLLKNYVCCHTAHENEDYLQNLLDQQNLLPDQEDLLAADDLAADDLLTAGDDR